MESADEVIRINYKEFERWKYEKFARHVNKRLLLRNQVDLHTFQLHYDSCCYLLLNFNDVRMWIGYAVKQHVKVLEVKMSAYDKTELPRCIFTCRSLEELNLQMGKAPYGELEHEGLVLPDIINLPSLKKLTLCEVEVYTSILEYIIARSPGLEDVQLIDSIRHLDVVASEVLKRLAIDGFLGRDKGITIACPRLIHFECTRWPLQDISWRVRPSLESAHIDTGHGCTFDGQSGFTGIFLHAKRLALFGRDMKLKTATKGAETETDSMPTAGMTFQCPLLETVTIQCSKDDDKDEMEKMVNAMVANGVSLEKIHVTFYEDIKWSDLTKRRRLG